jgi:hypothetical protein
VDVILGLLFCEVSMPKIPFRLKSLILPKGCGFGGNNLGRPSPGYECLCPDAPWVPGVAFGPGSA